MTYKQTDREPLGAPPPQYPGRVAAVRRFGTVVEDDNAIGTALGLGFDVYVRTDLGEQLFENVGSDYPPPPHDVDINPNTVVEKVVACWYIPEEDRMLFLIPLYEDSAPCS